MASLFSLHDKLARIVYGMDRGLTPKQVDTILEPALRSLKSVKLEGRDQALQANIIQLLSELDSKIQRISTISRDKIEKIHKSILSLKKEMLTHKIDVMIAYVSTSKSPDHNGAFDGTIKHLISEKVPFVVSRSVLCGADSLMSTREGGDWGFVFSPDRLDEGEWEVLSQTDGPNHGELVICIPKVLFGGVTGPEKLAKLDLKTDGSLKQISVKEAYAGPVGNNRYQDFSDMFSNDPKKTKMIYLLGHGGIGAPAGMEVDDYKKFLKFCSAQGCRGLLMLSCYSGGESTLIPIALSEKEQKTLSFPIAVQSLGDWIARTEYVYEIPGRLEVMKRLFENPGSLTLPNIRKTLQTIEGDKTKSIQNAIQMILPHSYQVPGGARPPVETPDTQAFTIADMRKEQVKKSDHVTIESKKYFLLFPVMTPLTLVHKGLDPIYISMTPGRGQHYVEHVRLCRASPQDWVNAFALAFEYDECSFLAYKIGVNKGFFIGKLESPQQTDFADVEILEDVAFMYGPDGRQFVYRRGDQYYSYENEKEKEISPFLYATKVYKILSITLPSSQSSRASTVGQQDKITLLKTLGGLASASDVEVEHFFDSLSDRDDKIELIFFIVSELGGSRNSLVKKLIEKEGMPPDLESYERVNLLTLAITRKNSGLVDYLLSKNPDFFIVSPKDVTPFDAAVFVGNVDLVRTMLEKTKRTMKKGSKRVIKNLRTPLLYANSNVEIVKVLLGAATEKQLAALWSKSTDLLKNAIHRTDFKMLKLLLHYGADPNAGTPLPLFFALWKKDIELVEYLLKHGADPLRGKDEWVTPFVDCVKCGTVDIFKKMLNFALDQPNSQKMLVAALISALDQGNDQIVDLLASIGVNVIVANDDLYLKLRNIIKKYEKINDYKSVEKIFRLIPSDEIKERVVRDLDIPGLTYFLVANQLVGPHIEKPSPFFWAIRQNDIGMAQSLLRGGESLIHSSENYDAPLFYAISEASPEMAVSLLNEYKGDFFVLDKYGDGLLRVALRRSDPLILQTIVNRIKKEDNPEKAIEGLSYVYAGRILQNMIEAREYKLVRDVIEMYAEHSERVGIAIILGRPDFIRYLIEEKIIDLNTPIFIPRYYNRPAEMSLFTSICCELLAGMHNPKDKSECRELLDWALENGGHIKEHMFSELFEAERNRFVGVYGEGGDFIRDWLKVMIQRADKDLVQRFFPKILSVNYIEIAEAALARGIMVNGTDAEPVYVMEELFGEPDTVKFEIIKWAVDHGVDVNLHSEQKEHPLVQAMAVGTGEEVIRYLLANGAVFKNEEEINRVFDLAFSSMYGLSLMDFLSEMGYKPRSEF